MPRTTRASTRGNFQFTQLPTSSSRKKRTNRLSLSPKRNNNSAGKVARSISTPPIPRDHPSHSKTPSFLANRSLRFMARQHAFAPFNGGTPLLLAQRDPILALALKSLPFFTGETHISPLEHIQEVSNVCSIHGVTQDNVAVRLLASSLKGKSLQWFRSLPHDSIPDWGDLGDKLCKHFEEKSDHLSLLEQLTTIKRAPQECMTDFNYWFEKTWDRILAAVKPSPGNSFLYYLRVLNSDIAMVLQTMGGTTLPRAYDMAIRAENTLIQGGKIAPRLPMPLFLEILNHQSSIAPIPTASSSQPLAITSSPSTSTSEMSTLESMMQTLMQGLDKKLQEQISKIKKNLQEQGLELRGQIQDQSALF